MSITNDIKARVHYHKDNELFFYEALPGTTVVRDLIISAQVKLGITPPFPANRTRARHAEFLNTLDNFAGGSIFSVSENPLSKPGNTRMARTEPIVKHVWDFRCFDEDQGIRCFGFFGGKNFFIALTWDYRENIEDFDEAVKECSDEWSRLFPTIPLFTGSNLDDYLTNYKQLA
ncbi:MAG: hypothetical protein ABI705_09555 [Aestuariivirga sp.]